MQGPQVFIRHLATQHYHPRSDAHSNALCLGILDDLLDQCEPFAEKAERGELVAKLNHTVTVNYQNWNIDLAVGPPPGGPQPPAASQRITFATPAAVELAIEAKGVMTEHGKARHNRLRDLQAFHSHAHMYDQKVIAGGVVVVNMSKAYWSPTRAPSDVTIHRDIERVAGETVALFRNLALRNAPADGAGLEAAAVLVVKHDNMLKNANPPQRAPAPTETVLVERAPAPRVGDPLHYATMIHRICAAYRSRWS